MSILESLFARRVIDYKNKLIPRLQELCKLLEGSPYKYYVELKEETSDLVEPIWGKGEFLSAHVHEYGARNSRVSSLRLQGDYVFDKTFDAKISGSVLYGWFVLSDSVRPNLRKSFILAKGAANGSNAWSNLSIDDTILGHKTFLEIEQDALSSEPERVFEAILRFSEIIPQHEYDKIAEWHAKYPEDKSKYEKWARRLVSSLPIERQKDFESLPQNDKFIMAVYRLDFITRVLAGTGDAYNLSISDSVVCGYNALNDVKGGTIRDSIVAGIHLLENSHVRILNSYKVNPDGHIYVKEQVIGQPEKFSEVPRLVEMRRPRWNDTFAGTYLTTSYRQDGKPLFKKEA